MSVVLDFEGSIGNLTQGLKQIKSDLSGVNDSYEKIGTTEKNVVSGAAANQDRFSRATQASNAQLKRQQKSIADLDSYLKRLEEGQRKATNPELIRKYNAEIAKTQAAIKLTKGESVGFFAALSTGASVSKAAFSALRGVISSTFAPLIAVGAILEGLRQVVTLVNKFEQSAADLSAITGATGDTLEFLKQKAVEVGLETTISADATLEAYKLIASAKPELLSNAQALADFTNQTILLTEAMGGELPKVATDLTDIMNQFGAPADQAARFVNALAAGSKEGSAEVDQLAASLVVAGSASKAANIGFEESVGVLEAIAEKGVKGAEAGTAFRNVALKLAATDVLPKEALIRLERAGVNIDKLSDKTLSFSDRLKELKPIQNDANALVSVFGLENFAAGQILLSSTERIDALTKAVTDTNVAQEQASVRTATASAQWLRLKNTIQALVQESGGGLSTFLGVIINFVREGLLYFRGVMQELKPVIDTVYNAFSGLFSAIARLLPAQKEAGENVSAFTTVLRLAVIPIKLLVFLLSSIVDTLAAVVNSFANASKSGSFFGRALSFIGKSLFGFVNVLGDIPGFVDGAIGAISVFISEVGKGIGQLGKNIGAVLSEAFDIKNILTNGTGQLFAAVGKLLTNPFEGIGEKARKAFNDGFSKSNARPKALAPTAGEVAPVDPFNPVSDQSFSRADEAAAKLAAKNEAAEKKKAEAAKKAAEAEAKRAKELEKAKIDALIEGKEKQLALEDLRYKDLLEQLQKFGLATDQATAQHEANKFEIKRKFIEETANLESLSGEERLRFIFEQNKAEIAALENSLVAASPTGDLSDGQNKQINFLKKQANDEFLKDLAAFQSEEQQKVQDHEIALLELRRGEFEDQIAFEELKEKAILDIRLKYAQQALALLENTQGAQSDAALALRKTINEIQGDIAEIAKKGADKKFNLYSLIGLDPESDKDAKIIDGINTAARATIDILSEVYARRVETAEQAIEASDKEIDSIQREIDEKEKQLTTEKEQAALGFASRQIEVEQEIDLLKRQQEAEKVEREKAVKEKQKAQKAQAILDTLTQGSSLITAAAQIFQSVAAIPFLGVGIAAGLVAAMIGSFVAAKVKVFSNINKQKARRGMTGKVTGKLHSQGGERFGDHIEVERDEAFGILSREATAKHGDAFEAFVKAANKNDLAGMYKVLPVAGAQLNRGLADKLEASEAQIVQMKTSITAELETSEIRKGNALLKELVTLQKQPKIEYLPDGTKIVKIGSTTKIIKKAK
jgi:TP901 family phage tail tape measure protein